MTDLMKKAIFELMANEPYSGGATPYQILAVCEKYDVEPHAVEGLYLDAVDELADE